MTSDKINIARQMYDTREHTVEAIAKTLGVSRKTIYRHLGKQPADRLRAGDQGAAPGRDVEDARS
jgi:DNA invertase Pin-like site-specific DNA recombinase